MNIIFQYSGILVVLFSFFGIVIPSILSLRESKKFTSYSQLALQEKTKNTYKISSILTGTFQIIYYLYLSQKYSTVGIGVFLLIISGAALALLPLFPYNKFKFQHYFIGFTYFSLSTVGCFLFGAELLSKNILLDGYISIFIPITLIITIIFSLIVKKNKTLFEELIHTFYCYLWIMLFYLTLLNH